MISSRQAERYEIERSPFYKMGRGSDLAAILGLSSKVLRNLIIKRSSYYRFKEENIDGKHRSLAVPIDEMRDLHERVQALLGRIILPGYLYSPRRGRTSIHNATVHQASQNVVKLDVKQFYPSTTDEHVFQLFHHRFHMIDDVAGRLTKLCTINGKVPFGSPVSPILCALTHNDIFSKAASRCELNENLMTLWVDDMTVSGTEIRRELIHDINRLIASKRLKSHKSQRTKTNNGIVITGAYIGPKGLAPANKSHRKLEEKLEAYNSETCPNKRFNSIQSLIGLLNYHLAVYDAGTENYIRVKRRIQWAHNEFRNIKLVVGDNNQPIGKTKQPKIFDDGTIPW